MSIALEALGPQYMEIAQAQGISPEAFHRVASWLPADSTLFPITALY